MNLQEVVACLMQEGYMVQIKGKYKVTAKFSKEMTGRETGLVPTSSGLVVVEDQRSILPAQHLDWPTRYVRFIQEAEVPQRGEGGSGSYDLNKYSEGAARTFRKMLEKDGVIYAVLVKSTMLYYKTHRRYPVAISRYIEEGIWRTDYLALIESARDGKLTDHIQNEIDNEKEFSRYRLG